MVKSFVFYVGFRNSIERLPEDIQLEAYKALIACGLGEKIPDDYECPINAVLEAMMPNIEAAHDRYEKAVSDGEKGGRPKKWIDREEAEKLYAELKSWDKVADELDVSRETLRKARLAWNAQKPKNLNINNNVNENFNVNENSQLTLINKGVSAQPKAALPPKEPKVRWEIVQDENGKTRFIEHVYDGGSETK